MEMHAQDTQPSRICFRIWIAEIPDERFVDGDEQIEFGHSTHGLTLEGAAIARVAEC